MKLSQLSGGLAKNYLKNIVKYKMGEEILLPYFATFYLTLRCNYACSFCDDGSAKQKYPDLKMDELNTEKTKKVLSILKNKCSSIYFTGGEPFLRKDLLDLCKFSKKIGFNPVSVNTNGFLLQKNLEVLDNIDNLVISLSSLDPVKYSKIVGRPISCFDIVMKNILIANSLKKKKGFEFVINCVVTEDSLLDAENVMNFCFQNKINFAVVPAMVGVYPDKDLLNSKAYRLFIDKIIAKKKNGNPVFNSYKYLQIIKNESAEVVFGVTKYVAKTEFQNLLKATIYGDNGVETTPGTLIMRDTFLKLGGFIEGVRTSDDLEWRERVRRNGLKCITPKEFSLTYSDISNSIYLNIKRFFLYQLHAASIDVQNKMKDIHLAFFLLLSALVIPRWNAIIGWKESLFYIPDVTKIYLLSLTSIFALKLLIDNLFRKKESSFIFSPFLKTIAFIVVTMMVINWNYAIAKWEEDALLYIPHITKFYVLFLLTSSLLYRGIYFPIKNGIAVSYLFPFKWIKVGLLGLALDIVKAPGYIFGAILYPYKKHRD